MSNNKDFLEVSLCRRQQSVSTTKYRLGSPRSANLMHVNMVISMVICRFIHYIITSKYHGFRADGNSPAALFFGRTSFSQGEKIKVHFY